MNANLDERNNGLNHEQEEAHTNLVESYSPSYNLNQNQHKSWRSTRTRTKPKRLDDFVTDLPPSLKHMTAISTLETSIVHLISQIVYYDRFSKTHRAFLAAITSHDEPKNFLQAIVDPN